MFPSYLPVKAPDPGAYHFNFLGHNQKCLTGFHGISPMYSDSFMIMSLYTTRDYVPPDFCGILSLMIFYYEEITL